MSMNFSNNINSPFKKIAEIARIKSLILIYLLILMPKTFADIGYEESTNIMIDTTNQISDINIGEDILYYDFEKKKGGCKRGKRKRGNNLSMENPKRGKSLVVDDLGC